MGKTYFDVSYETNSYVYVGETLKLNAKYIKDDEVIENLKWDTMDACLKMVDQEGRVLGSKPGISKVKVWYENDVFYFYVTVLSGEESELVKEFIKNNYSNALTVYNLGIGSKTNPRYCYDLVSSANNYLFAPLRIDKTYYDKLPEGVKNNGKMDKVEYVCVHYTGNMNNGADADNNASYLNNLEYAASIHYVTGRTNLYRDWNKDDYVAFADLNEIYGGWHASDTKQGPHKWLKTGVKCENDDNHDAIISISKNSYYTINGIETIVKVPEREDGIAITGPTFEYEGKTCNSINSQGISYKVIDGEYYLGNTWWGRQQFGNTLCNIGGNFNSIGIESCVDIGSDLWHTWQVTAQLVSYLLKKYDLTFDRVAGHHYFSGKDCPQPMLANNGQLWDAFMNMVKADYKIKELSKGYEIKMTVIDGKGTIDEKGLITQSDKAKSVLYRVSVMYGDKEVDGIYLASLVESNLKYDGPRTMPSLQNIGYDIK